MLTWNEYLKKGLVRKTSLNKELIKSIVYAADNGINVISKIEINKETSSIIFSNCYDSLRKICEAIALLNNYKIYSHEALGLFLKEVLKEDIIFKKFDRFRLLRNNAQYYGKIIPFEESKQCIVEIKDLIQTLKTEYLKQI